MITVIIEMVGSARAEIEVPDADQAREILARMKDMTKPLVINGTRGATLINPRHVIRAFFET